MHFALYAEFLFKRLYVLFKKRRKGYARDEVHLFADVHIVEFVKSELEVILEIGKQSHAVFNLVERTVIRTVFDG